MDANAERQLEKMRVFIRESKLVEENVIEIGTNEYVIMLWISSNKLEKMQYALIYLGYEVDNRDYYLLVKTKNQNKN